MVGYHKFLRPQLVQRYFNSQRKEMSCQLNRVFPFLTSEPGRSTGILKAISFCLFECQNRSTDFISNEIYLDRVFTSGLRSSLV